MEKITIECRTSSIWIYPFYMRKDANKMNINPTSTHLEGAFTDWEEGPTAGIRYPVFPFTYMYDSNNHIFKVPVGFTAESVQDLLTKDNPDIPIEIIHKCRPYRIREVDIKVKEGIKPKNDIQKEAINFLLTERNPSKLLTLATGFGKTFCVIYTAAQKKVPFLIISSKLSKQWIEQIHKFIDLDEDDIYEIRGQASIDKLMKMKKPKHLFYVASSSTMYSALKKYEDLDPIFEHLGIGVKVFDEAHEYYKTNAEIDCNSEFAETYYLTATPIRSIHRENNRYSKMFKDIPKHGMETHFINKNYIIYLINYNTKPSALEVKKAMRYSKNQLNAFTYSSQIMKNPKKQILFFGMILSYILKVRSVIDGKILVVLTTLEQISLLKVFLSKYLDSSIKITRYDSTVPKDRRNESKDGDIILTTFGIAYAGLDISNLASVFSLSPYQTQVGASQLLGRLSRNERDVYFLDFLDEGYKRMFTQRKNRMREIEPRAKKIYKRVVTEKEVEEFLKNFKKGK